MKPWELQERRVARKTGGKRQPGSGSGWLHQNDVKDDTYLREMKQTSGKSISVTEKDWMKLKGNAVRTGRQPILHLEIGNLRLVVHEEDWPCGGDS